MVIAALDNGKLLFERQYRHPLQRVFLELPAGKIDPGETSLECAVRETFEELGVTAHDAVKRGELWFQFVDGLAMHVAVFLSWRHDGEATETEEAAPLWTAIDAIPFEKMWADDQHWLHRMLTGGESFMGRFIFDGDAMLSHDIVWDRLTVPS